MPRKLEAPLAVADETASLIITGTGDVKSQKTILLLSAPVTYAQVARAVRKH